MTVVPASHRRVARDIVAAMALLALAGCSGASDPTFQGWVEADFVFVGPDDPGRVVSLLVREGDPVAVGAPIFTLDDDLQRSDLAAGQASVKEARARLARLEAEQQRPAEIAVLEAQQERLAAMLALSTAEYERQKALDDKRVTSKSQLDIAQANFNRDKAAAEEIRRQIKLAHLAARDEDVAAARQVLAAAEARLASSDTKLARRSVASPVSGTVRQIYFRPGEMVPAGRPVLSVLPPANIKVRFFVPEVRLPGIKLGETVWVICDGCGGDIAARIDFIAQTAEFTPPVVYTPEERAKLVYLVEARPAEPGRVRVGQPVRVALAGEQR